MISLSELFNGKPLSSFGLKNFRVFKEYTNFKLKPFTILVGPNNSGKSSVNKALVLLKENEEQINYGLSGSSMLNYFGGEHNLGNHQLVKNSPEQITSFYFSFFLDYQFTIDISPEGFLINDYSITKAGKPVISQDAGHIRFHFLNLIDYFKSRVSKGNFDDVLKLNHFITRLEEQSKDGYHSVDINLWDEIDRTDHNGKVIEGRAEELLAKYKQLRKEGIFAILFDLDCSGLDLDIDYINEDILDEDFYISLIYLFYKITGIELNQEEITQLIPFKTKPNEIDSKKFISFKKIVFIPTIKEQIKRTYSTLDQSIINDIINKAVLQKTKMCENTFKHEVKIRKDSKEQQESFRSVNEFAEKWLKEFEIGEKLSYGYETETDTFYIKIDDKHLPEYGFGYSQVLYLIFALHNEIYSDKSYAGYSIPKTYIIEEPETGLHPAFQSKITEMIVDAHKIFGVNFIIETHSEYFIRKLQLLTAEKTISPDDTAIYYFNNPKDISSEDKLIKEITIDKYGGLSDSFGKGFYDEATSLKFELIHLNKKQ